MRKVRILGGGFSGLTLAWRLAKAGRTVELFEKSDRLGGLLGSHREHWGLVEQAANAILNSKHVEELASDLGLDILPSDRKSRNRYILRDGKLHRWPLGVFETLRMLKGAFDYYSKNEKYKPIESESLENYVSRVFGSEFYHFLVSPALCGVFGTDQLNPVLLAKAFHQKSRPALSGIKGSVSFHNGMGEMTQKLVERCRELGVHIQTCVAEEIDPRHLNVLATDAHTASILLTPYSLPAAKHLADVKYQALTSVTLGFSQAGHDTRGFGVLFSKPEGRNSLGVLLNTCIFTDRGPSWTETYIFDRADLSETQFIEQALEDRKIIFGATNKPEHSLLYTWPKAVPVYDENVLKIMRDIELPEYVFLHGNYLGKIGLQKILDRSYLLAQEIQNL